MPSSDATYSLVAASVFGLIVIIIFKLTKWIMAVLFRISSTCFQKVFQRFRVNNNDLSVTVDPSLHILRNASYRAYNFANILVLSQYDECENVLQKYYDTFFHMAFIGLDCEWVTAKNMDTHPVALLQLATPVNDCFLIRLCKLGDTLPKTLVKILEDKGVLKFGVGILEDARKLCKVYGINVQGCVDLRHVVMRCQSYNDIGGNESQRPTKLGLASLAKEYLGVEMDKSWRVRCSNWEADHLTVNQIEYAAHDAIVAVHIFLILAEQKASTKQNYSKDFPEKSASKHLSSKTEDDEAVYDAYMTPILSNPIKSKEMFSMHLRKYMMDPEKGYALAENIYCSTTFKQRAFSLCQGIINLGFKDKLAKKQSKDYKIDSTVQKESLSKPYKCGTTLRKTPLYSKCQLIAPDGAMLCTFDRKKAQWYLDKEIGKLVCEDPFTVQLKFEPSARPQDDDSYYLTFKENVCVVCGSQENYSRKSIVPHEYRKYFPDCMKNHHSHDVVLLCPHCHRLSSIFDEQLRQRLALKYQAPLGNKEFSKFVQDPVKLKVKSAARALLQSKDKLPLKRQLELLEVIQDFYQDEHVTLEMLQNASQMEVQKENLNYKCHGEVVIQKVKEKKELLEFEKMWRVHFFEMMCPQFLPDLWSVDHRQDRTKTALNKLNLI